MTDLPALKDDDPKYLMVITDHLLKSCTVEAMNSVAAGACAERFLNCHYRFHGFPKYITSDRGSNWVGHFWSNLCKLTGIKQRRSTAYHPQTDGSTERMNQEVLKYLRAFLGYSQTDWPKLLPTAMSALNNRESTIIGTSPFFATHGYNADPIQQTPSTTRSTKSPLAQAETFVKRINIGQEIAQAAMKTAQQIMEKSANRHRRPAEHFKPGDAVWLNLKNVDTPQLKKKLSWTQGKYRVQAELPQTFTNLMFPQLDDTPPPPLLEGEQGLWAVDQILRAERINGYRTVLVRWNGFAEPTWEPRENLRLMDAFKDFTRQYGGGDKVGLDQGMITDRTLKRTRPQRKRTSPR
ncbi:hypothetical protein K3495_g2905 [Podosphaera aphanis]|nr:hypothetical protein K3495_g2905 [Podosphaera aphanis]